MLQSEKIMSQTTREESKEAPSHLTGLALASFFIGLCFIVFLVTLDLAIVATAIPKITDEFNTIADIGWYASAFLLTQVTFILLAGRTYTYFPFKTTYISYIAVFEIGSVICGAAQSSKMLVAGRAVAGIGGSGVMNGTMTILYIALPPERRAMGMGIILSLYGLGQLVGPLISGGITEHASWRWCFYINLPVGAFAVLCFAFIKLPAYQRKPWTAKTLFWDLDVVGFTILAPACVMLLLAIQWGGIDYAWSSATIIGMLCGSIASFASFVVWEMRMKDQAMVPQSLVRRRPLAFAVLAAYFQGGGMVIITYYLPLFFQAVDGVSPTLSGVRLLPLFLGQLITAAIVGSLMSRMGFFALAPMILGQALTAICYGLFSSIQPGSGKAAWIGYQVIGGIGRGISVQLPVLVAQTVASEVEVSTATSIIIWGQFLGMATMIGAAQAIFVDGLKSRFAELLPQLSVDRAIRAGATAFIASVPETLQELVVKAYNDGLAGTFYLGLAVSLSSLFAAIGIWNLRIEAKPKEKKESTDLTRTESAPQKV